MASERHGRPTRDAYSFCGKTYRLVRSSDGIGWRREHAHRVWQAAVSLAFAACAWERGRVFGLTLGSWDDAIVRPSKRLVRGRGEGMHTGPMSESQGDFKEGYKPSGSKCPRCGAPMQYRTWESSCGGYEDEKHECTKCDYVRWVEGPDS